MLARTTLEETHLHMLRLLAARPEITQREMAEELGVSLGKINYCLKALFERGLLKMRNFKNSHNKMAYAYYLTPAGMRRKTGLTVHFLNRKLAEYENLKLEIESLRAETRAFPMVDE